MQMKQITGPEEAWKITSQALNTSKMKYKLTHYEIKIKQVLTAECVKQLNAYSPWMKLDQKSSEA